MKLKKRFSASFWGRGLLFFLAIMLLFTLVSRLAASLTVARVSVMGPSSNKIQHTVTVEGRIDKNRELSILTQPDLLVEQVLVNVGQRVKKGETLAELNEADLAEQLTGLKGEKRALELQNQAIRKNQDLVNRKRQRNIARAKADYKRICKENEKARKQKKKRDKAEESVAKEKEREAKRAIRDAEEMPEADSSIEVNNIAIEKLDVQIGKLQSLKEKKGQIRAPKSGVITSILVNVGQKTVETGIFTMADEQAGLKFEGQMSLDDAKYVSPGEEVTLSASGKKKEDLTVNSLELDESKEFMLVTVLLPANPFSIGESASMNVVQESINYPCVVPLTALRQENNKYYVLVAEQRDTVLGEQLTAVKEEVKVLEKNEKNAALESDSLKEDSQIITDMDRYVEAGDRVRLREE